MTNRTCLECGAPFQSRRYRVTCSRSCAKVRRQRQLRDIAARRWADPETREHMNALKRVRMTPETRQAAAERERQRRANMTEADRQRLAATRRERADTDPDIRNAQREANRRWYAGLSPKQRDDRRDRQRARKQDPANRETVLAASRRHYRKRRQAEMEARLINTLTVLGDMDDGQD